MLVMIVGIFRPGGEEDVSRLQSEFNAHLEQPLLRIRSAGSLRKEDGSRAGFAFLLETDTIEAANGFLGTDPFLDHGLYEQVHLFEYAGEAGHV